MLSRPTILCITFLFSTAGSVAFTTSCTQPLLNCGSAQGAFAAEYTLTQGDPNSACGQLDGDVLGISTYYQAGGMNGTPDYENATVAIRPESLGIMIDYALAREVIDPNVIDPDVLFYRANAIGSFTAGYPNDDTFCMAEDFETSQVSLPAIEEIPADPAVPDGGDETQPAQPAIDVTYKWSNARFVVSADAQGTQFEADLEYTQDGCTANYHVVGVYPPVECKTDDECHDDTNGINPDFAVRCNTDLDLCVLNDDLPAYE
jgi:hypothetical protein